MKYVRGLALACVTLAMISLFLMSKGQTRAASAQGCHGTWKLVTAPDPGPYSDVFNAVVALKTSDVWAAGSYIDANGETQALLEHWNGSAWETIPGPQLGSVESMFQGLARIPGTDTLWAVGFFDNPAASNVEQTLIEYWNGTDWSVVPSPNAGTSTNELDAVTALSATDAWAVGNALASDGYTSQALIEHWDGTSWSIVPGLLPGQSSRLYGVAAITTHSVWAVGQEVATTPPTDQTFIEHWNGTAWNQLSIPNPGADYNILKGIARVPGTTDLWTVGYDGTTSSPFQTLALEKQHRSWNVIASANPGTTENDFSAVTATSSTQAWAVGEFAGSNSLEEALIEEWNGTAWQVSTSVSIASYENDLTAVSHVPGSTQAWAVGSFYASSGGSGGALVEHYC